MSKYPDSWKYSATAGWVAPVHVSTTTENDPKPAKVKKPRTRKGKGNTRLNE